MTRLIVRRLMLSFPLLFIASIVTFVLEAIVPGNAATQLAGLNATHQAYEKIYVSLGLNHPIWYQYGHWVSQAVRGNLGNSIFSGQSVVSELGQSLPVTLSLMGGVLVLSVAIGIPLGVLGALKEGVFGRTVDIASMLGLALPAFWVALELISLLAVKTRIFPATGYTYFSSSPISWFRGLILPWFALSLGGITIISKQTRDSMRTSLDRPFIRSLRAAGVSNRSVIWKHALRNAALPIVTRLGTVLIGSLAGSVFIESVFVLPGLGSAAVAATTTHDLPIIAGIAMYFTLITIFINLLIDVAYGWLNPRVRVS